MDSGNFMTNGTILSTHQIKAARALLDWSQEDLASATDLSIATIRKLELGYISPRSATTTGIRKAFEDAGIEFLDSEGVRRRQEDISTFRGAEGCEDFLEDMEQTARKNGGEIMIVAMSIRGLSNMFGSDAGKALGGLAIKDDRISIKVILANTLDLPFSTPQIEYRSLSPNYVNPMPFCVFGDKYAVPASNEREIAKVVVMRSTAAALSSKRQFGSMWEKAMPLQVYNLEAPAKKVAAVR